MLRWGIVGFGDIAQKAVAPAIRAHGRSELTAICRRRRDALAAGAAEFEVPHAYHDYQAMLAGAPIDAVYVATPVALHAPQARAAIERGLHVLVEKPMTLHLGEAEELVEAAERARVVLGVAYYQRFYPVNRRARELVSSGDLGTPIALHGNASAALDLTPDDPKAWRLDLAQSGGGPLMDLASHRLETFHSLAGEAARVAAFVDRRGLKGDVEDTASLIVQYRSGVQATLSSCWSVNPARGDYEVWCTHGYIRVPYTRGDELIVQRGSEVERQVLAGNPLHDLPLIEDFVDAVEGRAEHQLPGKVGLEVQRVLEAAYVSAAERRVVTL